MTGTRVFASISEMTLRRLYNAYLSIRSQLAESDIAYRLLITAVSLVRPNQKYLIASHNSEIVIDGFPRSANTFFVSFVEIAQDRPVRIGRHLHESWQFRFAEKHNIPCVVLIREPLAAVTSAVLRDPRADARTLLNNYVRLYENMLEHRKRAVIAPFEVVVKDANRIIAALNKVYGSKFKLMTEDRSLLVAEEVKSKDQAAFRSKILDQTRIAAPSEAKRHASAVIRAEIEDRLGAELSKASLVYQKVLECAARQ